MNSPTWNIYAMAILGTLLVTFGVGVLSDIIFAPHETETPGYVIEVAEAEGAEGAAGEAAQATTPLPVLLASADPAAGENVAKKCVSCHSFEQGGPNKIGPNLWNIVDRPIAAHEGFSYSEALRAYAEGGKVWNWSELDGFITNPKGHVPGTAMSFAGIKQADDRAALLLYMRGMADNPAPLPDPATAGATEEVAAEGAAPAEGTRQANEGAPEPLQGGVVQADPPNPPAVETQQQQGSDTPADNAGQGAGQGQATGGQAAGQQQPAAQAQLGAAGGGTGGGLLIVRPRGQAGGAAPAAGQPTDQDAPAAEQPAQPQPAEQGADAGQQGQAPADAAPQGAGQQVAQAEGTQPAQAPAGGDLPPAVALVAEADPAAGQKLARRCASCHNLEEGGPNVAGPNLWGVVNRPVASVADYDYSEAMRAHAQGGKVWDYAELDAFITNPKAHVPGTIMVFPGIKKDQDRAAVLAYLRTLAAEPAPLPGAPQ